jgi:DNA-3-methyladenine glycosylase I
VSLEATKHDDGKVRCGWAKGADYLRYHDDEWGRPVTDDQRLFEKLCLEGFQSGLSWITILRKRPRFREVFHDFDPARVARLGARDVARLLKDPGIVRHRGKIEATIGNARALEQLLEVEPSFAGYIWRFAPAPEDRPKTITPAVLRTLTTTPASVALSKDLKKRGFRFVGPTTVYAFMQAMGLVNDHLDACAFRSRCERERAAVVSSPRPAR